MASSYKNGAVRPNALDYSVSLAHLNKASLLMWLFLYLPEPKADYFINLYMWYEVEHVLETISSDRGVGTRLRCLHWVPTMEKLRKKKLFPV